MPTRKKRPAKKAARKVKKAPAKKAAPKKKTPVKKAAAKRPAARKTSASAPAATPSLNGWITHTEIASSDPVATKEWAMKALGWTFPPPFPMDGGEMYHMFAYSDKGGGGIRRVNPPETAGSIPYVKVDDIKAAFAKAISAGAVEMMPPTFVMEGVTIAIVRAPGGVPIGLSGP